MVFLLKFLFVAVIFFVGKIDCHDDDVYTVELTKDTFVDAINANNYFVMFFAPW